MLLIDFLIVFFLLVALFSIGNITAKKTRSQASYLVADRDIKLFPLMATLIMTEFNATTFVSHAAAGYSAGLRALALPAVLFICLIFYAITVAKKWKEYNGESIAHYFSLRYSRTLGIFSALCFLFAMIGLTATYIKSFTILVRDIFPQYNQLEISAALVCIVALVSVKGGLRSIIRIDMCSFVALLIFLMLMAYYSFHYEPGTIQSNMRYWEMPHQLLSNDFLIAFILFACLSYLAAPWYGQKILAAKSRAVSYNAAVLAAFFVFLMYSVGVICSKILFSKGVSLTDRNYALSFIIANVLPHGVKGFGLAIIITVSITTVASAWNVMTALIVGDMVSKQTNLFRYDRLIAISMGLLSFLVTNVLIDDVFSKMILVSIPLVSFSFAILGGFYWKRANHWGASISILTGISTGIITYIDYGDSGNWLYHWIIGGVPLIFLTGIIFSYITAKLPVGTYKN